MNGIPSRVPLTISEADWQQIVIDTARWYDCLVAHFRPAMVRDGRWVTPMSGDVGFPDLVISRDGWVLVVELKRNGKNPSPAQRRWLAALGAYGRCWKPSDWPEALATLRDGPAPKQVSA